MEKILKISWLNEKLQNECVIKRLNDVDNGVLMCSDAYKCIFNGAPFYENWTIESALEQVLQYVDEQALILVPEYRNKIIGFLVAIKGVPENQKEFIPYSCEQIDFIEEIGVVSNYRNMQIASEMVRILLLCILNRKKESYLGYRTNAMRYFEQINGESFEAGVIRVQQEDIIKRKTGEKIIIPEFTQSEKQTFINNYLELLTYRPDLDVSNSNLLFRNIFGSINFCRIGDNYSFQQDPSNNGNDRIFPIIDLSSSNIRSRRR